MTVSSSETGMAGDERGVKCSNGPHVFIWYTHSDKQILYFMSGMVEAPGGRRGGGL